MHPNGIKRLLEGNRRFAQGLPAQGDRSPARRAALTAQQEPFALILSCSDSRVPPEIVFDCGLGELFVVRTAGHTLDDAVLETIQFGVHVLQIPLMVVLGHTGCGAVSVAVDHWRAQSHEEAPAGTIVQQIAPAIAQCVPELPQTGDPHFDDAQMKAIVRAHVQGTVDRLSHAHADLLAGVQVVGAIYHLDAGVVELLSA